MTSAQAHGPREPRSVRQRAVDRDDVSPVPELDDSNIGARGAPGAKTVRSRTNEAFPDGARHSPQRGVTRRPWDPNRLIL